MNRLFVCTDLDRTLLPNGQPPESDQARSVFARFVGRPEVVLAYVSGRNRGLVQEAMENYQIPTPDWVIGDVGTSIYRIREADWEPWISWQEEIAPDWQGLNSGDLQGMFNDLEELVPQEPEQQNTYKLSYYVDLSTPFPPLQRCMAPRLQERGLSASLIYSVDEEKGIGLLDVLPAHATKLHAVEFLMKHQGFSHGDTVFAGDSGNDLPILCSAVPSVLVANAHPETIREARLLALQNKTEASFYLAQGGFLGMNGNYSAGILEGIAHYHPGLARLMQ